MEKSSILLYVYFFQSHPHQEIKVSLSGLDKHGLMESSPDLSLNTTRKMPTETCEGKVVYTGM